MKTTKTSTQLTETQKQELNGYAAQVNLLQSEIITNDNIAITHGKKSLELAIKAGEALRAAKKLVKHGQWEKWVEENVPTVSKRTIENYMKLAQEKAIAEERMRNEVQFGIKAQINAFFNTCQSLGEAYRAVGIIKNTSASGAGGEDSQSPEAMKRDNKGKYEQMLNDARQKMLTYVHNQIGDSAKGVNWNLSTWTIKNNKPCSGDTSNSGAALFHTLLSWISLRNNSSLTREDEIRTKAGIVLNEIVKAIMLATAPTESDVQNQEAEITDIVPYISFEQNHQPVEVVEMTQPALG